MFFIARFLPELNYYFSIKGKEYKVKAVNQWFDHNTARLHFTCNLKDWPITDVIASTTRLLLLPERPPSGFTIHTSKTLLQSAKQISFHFFCSFYHKPLDIKLTLTIFVLEKSSLYRVATSHRSGCFISVQAFCL